jgi:hypothetical protein
MKEPNHTPAEFCDVVSHFTGERITKIGQLSLWNMGGTELYEFCQFYFGKVYSRFLSEELRRKDNTIYRLRCIVVALCIIIAVLIIK